MLQFQRDHAKCDPPFTRLFRVGVSSVPRVKLLSTATCLDPRTAPRGAIELRPGRSKLPSLRTHPQERVMKALVHRVLTLIPKLPPVKNRAGPGPT